MASNTNCEKPEKWYFTKEQLDGTPSRQCGLDALKERSYRQQAANFIQDMGQKLKVSQLCINTAIVYMHRFYVFHSFTNFPWHQMAAASLFLAAKVEEQPRKLEYVIRVANVCRNPKDTTFDVHSERYLAQSQDLVFNENVLLQTLGFDVAIDHPHTHVVRCCRLVRASKDLAQTSYFMASNSLHLTTMCLQYKPTVVACFCIHVACKWSNWEIPLSNEDKEWFSYIDNSVTTELLQQLTKEFLVIFETSPSRHKEKSMAMADNAMAHAPIMLNSPFDQDPRKIIPEKDSHSHRSHDGKVSESDPHKHRSSRPHEAGSSSQHQREREYREKKERERLAQHHGQKIPPSSTKPSVSSSHSAHHRAPHNPKMSKPHSRLPPPVGPPYPPPPPVSRTEPRDILREAATKDSPFGIATKDFRDREHNSRELNVVNKDAVRGSSSNSNNSEKDVQQQKQSSRDYLLKPNVASDTNSLNNYPDNRLNYSTDRIRMDPNRPPSSRSIDPNKKHVETVRRQHEDPNKPYIKSETDNIKKHLSSVHDKNSTYLNKPSNSTSQKVNKSPFSQQDASKSVPKPYPSLPLTKSNQHNGSSNNGSSYNLPAYEQQHNNIKKEPSLLLEEVLIKEEPKDDIITYHQPAPRKSLFSPEKSPSPRKHNSSSIKIEQKTPIKKEVIETTPVSVPTPQMMDDSPESGHKRVRAYSSGSEPELRPVLKKIDQVEGFENLMRDSTIGINKLHKVPDIITPFPEIKTEPPTIYYSKEMKPPDIIPPIMSFDPNNHHHPIVNGIETNPTAISNLLKSTTHLPTTVGNVVVNTTTESILLPPATDNIKTEVVEKEREHHHHKSKKKNKEKHKHKDKNREDKEKKKKHKDKDRHKHREKDRHESSSSVLPSLPTANPPIAQPIKIKIQKDKIQTIAPVIVTSTQPPSSGGTLKIKIPKDKIKTEGIGESSVIPSGGSLKIKISKDVINNCSVATNDSSSGSSKKRERDYSSPGSNQQPPNKMPKTSHRESKQNGRHSYNKVIQQGDGDTSLHRLAESKYTKGSTS